MKNISFLEFLYRLKRWFNTKYLENKLKDQKKFLLAPRIDPNYLKEIRLPWLKNSQSFENEGCFEKKSLKISDFEKNVRSMFFSKIKINSESPDIRSVWEYGRLQQVSKILFFDIDNSTESLNTIKEDVVSWILENSFLYGVHYMSPMECGLRIPVFFYLLRMEKISWKVDERQAIESALYRHTWWVSKNLALYSSLGNHTICECIGLIFGGAVFRETKEGKKWLKTGCRLLEQELSHQILKDGGPAEQSLNYHRFVLDLYWLAVDFLESNNLYSCSEWKDLLHKGERFLDTFLFDDSQFPAIGDSDDGYAVAPGLYPKRQTKDSTKALDKNNISYKTFQESGYTVIKSSDGIYMTFDHGPLGMAPLYNHGHADALSINLYKNRKAFFIDPGTYRYNGVPRHREYFKGTRAHNTVCIDGKDQARQLTGFIWDKQYKAELEKAKQSSDRLYFRTSHEGYRRLKDGVTHYRELIVQDDVCCLIVDSFAGRGVHEFELNFHLDPDVEIDMDNEWIVLHNGRESIFVYNPNNYFSIINGQEEPLLGWYSPAYGLLQKTNTLQRVTTGSPEDSGFMTLVCFNEINLKEAIQIREEFKEN